MYKTKPRFLCSMPSDAPLNVLALNASLKHEPTLSNTGELASLVLDEMRALAPISVKVVRLSDATLPVGLGFREAAEDDWPDLVTKIKAAEHRAFLHADLVGRSFKPHAASYRAARCTR